MYTTERFAHHLGFPVAVTLALILFFGCDSSNPSETDDRDSTDTTDTNGVDTTAHDTLSAADTAETITYELTIYNDWGPDEYPANYPDGAHFSHLGGAVHNADVTFWGPGDTVSDGMREMAETGNVLILAQQEVPDAIARGDAWSAIFEQVYTPAPPEVPPGSRTTMVTMHRDFPLITLATMLGPSPDWFVGVSGLSLWKEGKWQERVEVDLPLWDGGTREGVIPVMGGPQTIPAEPVSLITYEPDLGLYIPTKEPHIVGRMVFRRID